MTEQNNSELGSINQADRQIGTSRIALRELGLMRHVFATDTPGLVPANGEYESIGGLALKEAQLIQECADLNSQFNEVQAAFGDIPSLPVDQVSDAIRGLCERQKGIWSKYSEIEEALGAVKEKIAQKRNQNEVL